MTEQEATDRLAAANAQKKKHRDDYHYGVLPITMYQMRKEIAHELTEEIGTIIHQCMEEIGLSHSTEFGRIVFEMLETAIWRSHGKMRELENTWIAAHEPKEDATSST
jgi:hypothetical protein